MGPERSLEKLRQKIGKNTSYIRQLGEWSSQYDWVSSARQYDEQISYITVQDAADAYRQDLADYRKRYGDMGKALYGSAAKLLKKVNNLLDTMDVANPGSLLTVINAAKTAADLEALALRVEHLLNESGSEQSI